MQQCLTYNPRMYIFQLLYCSLCSALGRRLRRQPDGQVRRRLLHPRRRLPRDSRRVLALR